MIPHSLRKTRENFHSVLQFEIDHIGCPVGIDDGNQTRGLRAGVLGGNFPFSRGSGWLRFFIARRNIIGRIDWCFVSGRSDASFADDDCLFPGNRSVKGPECGKAVLPFFVGPSKGASVDCVCNESDVRSDYWLPFVSDLS